MNDTATSCSIINALRLQKSLKAELLRPGGRSKSNDYYANVSYFQAAV